MIVMGVSLAVSLIYVGVFSRFPQLGDVAVAGPLLEGLALVAAVILPLFGLPYFLVFAHSRTQFWFRSRRARRMMAEWAPHHGWQFHKGRIGGAGWEAPQRIRSRNLVHWVAKASKELGLVFRSHDVDEVRISDVACGEIGGVRAVVCTLRALDNPVHHARLIGLDTDLHLPALSYVDTGRRALWQPRKQRFESRNFNLGWHVIAEDRRYASEMTHPRVIALLSESPHSSSRIDVAGSWLVAWVPDEIHRFDLDSNLVLLRRLVDLIPEHVRHDYGP